MEVFHCSGSSIGRSLEEDIYNLTVHVNLLLALYLRMRIQISTVRIHSNIRKYYSTKLVQSY